MIKDKLSGTYIGPFLTAKKDLVCTGNYITNYNLQKSLVKPLKS